MTAVPILVGVFGSLIGSFLNVVVYRVPAGLSVVRPASACPRCGSAIRGYDNIPVISWLVLRGRCRDCGARISPRYPLVELGTALAFAGIAVWFGLTQWQRFAAAEQPYGVIAGVLAGLAFLYLAAVSIALALIDIDVKRLPDAIVLPSYAVAAVLLAASGVLVLDGVSLLRTLVGGAAMFAFYLVIALVSPAAMGFGDVKLAGLLGLCLGYLGWAELAVGALAAFVLGGLYGIALIALRRAGRKSGIPFGPWMLAGAWIGAIAGGAVADWYLRLFQLV